jgi:uncharacterized protein
VAKAGMEPLRGETLLERIPFRGHPKVSALHPTTIEITMEDHLTERGDCIVGVGAQKGCAQLSEGVKAGIRRASSTVILRLVVGSESFAVKAAGDPRLTLSHPHEIVVRKSDFVSDRTVAVRADAAARDIPRSMVARLRNPASVGFLEIEVG